MNEKKKILIIDDDKFLLNMYSMKFEKNGFEVKVANGGVDAIETLKEGYKPDVLLMDLIMPVMDGFSMYETIKKENLAPGALAIMLTNQGLITDINRAKISATKKQKNLENKLLKSCIKLPFLDCTS